MKLKLRVLIILLCLVSGRVMTQQSILLFQEDFNSGNNTFQLNTTGPSLSTGTNKWVINNNFNGNSIYPNTTLQNNTFSGTIAGAPSSNYLHIQDKDELGTLNCNYNNEISSDNFAAMSRGFCTVGLIDIKFTFFYIAEGSTADFGRIYYSIDGGTNWIPCGAPEYNNQSLWKYEVISDVAFQNQPDIRFGFRWRNEASGGMDKISFGIDDILAVGTYDTNNPVKITCTPSPSSVCEGGTVKLDVKLSSSLCAGNYVAQLSDANGNFGNPQQWSFNLGSGVTSRTSQYTMPNVQGGCYRFRVNRVSPPPAITGEVSVCIPLTDCPNTITTLKPAVTIGPDTTCVNSVIDVPFYSTGAFNSNNAYIAQLSDANGDFSNPQVLGSLPSSRTFDPSLGSQPGSVPGLIPVTAPGCNYYIRVISTSPAYIPSSNDYFGPFCLRECDIKTNNLRDVSICVTPNSGKDTTLSLSIHSFGNDVSYGVGNQFSVQILRSNSYQIINTGTLGNIISSSNSTLTLSVPGLQNLIPILGAPGTGMYYLRIVPTNASSTTNNLGTLVRLTIGSPFQSPLNLFVDDTLICAGSLARLFYTPRNSRSTYQWYSPFFNNNQPFYWASNPLSAQFSASTPPGVYTFTVRENNFGCFNPWSDTVSIHVNTIPNVNITAPNPVCIGDSINLKVQYQPATYYEWDAIGGSLLDESNNIIKMLYDSVGVYKVKVFALNECGSRQNTGNINVRDIPDIKAIDDIVICEDLPVTLSATSLSATSYSWASVGAVQMGNLSTLQIVSDSTMDYVVTAFNSFGCKNRDTVNVRVIKNPNTPVTFVQSDTLGCAPFSSTFSSTTANAMACDWNFSNGQKFNDCGPIAVDFTDPGCYDFTLTVTDSNQCASTASINDIICAEAPPIAQFSASDYLLSIFDTEVEFYNESLGATAYEWTFGTDGKVYSDEHPVYQFPPDDSEGYATRLIAISTIGCRDTAYSFISLKEDLTFYVPNTFTPDNDEFNQVFKPVFTPGYEPYDFSLLIFNRWGELIFESNNPDVGWDGSFGKDNLKVSHCDEGIYGWKIQFLVSGDHSPKSFIGHVNLLR